MIKELVVGAMLVSGVTQVAAPQLRSGAQPQNPQATWSYVNELEDGGVYFIRNVVDDDKVMDVYNHDYSNSGTVRLWDSNGLGNQRFIVHKRNFFGGNDDVYTFTPINAQDRLLTIQDKASSENKRLKIRSAIECDTQASTNKYYANSFRVVEGSSSGRFKIQTGASGFDKYLTTYNYGSASGTDIVQKTFIPAYYECYEWYFQRVDTLGIYAKNEAVINGVNWQQFWLKVPSSGRYTIRTFKREYNLNDCIDTYMELTDDENNNYLLKPGDDDNSRSGNDVYLSRIDYYLQANHSYGVRVRGYNNDFHGDIYIDVIPEKTLTINENVCGITDLKIDTRSFGVSSATIKGYLQNSDIVYQETVNATTDEMIMPNGSNLFNSYIQVFKWQNDYSNNTYLQPYDVLWNYGDLSHTKLVVFAYGGSQNYARNVVDIYGAEYAIGFDTMDDSSVKSFLDRFFSTLLKYDNTIERSYEDALSWVRMSEDSITLYH